MTDAIIWAGATFYITESIKVFAVWILYPYIIAWLISKFIEADNNQNYKEVQR